MSYSIYQADLNRDKKSIIDFWKTNFPGWPEKKFEWFYENNPDGPAWCWIIKETENSEVGGTTAVFPRKVFIQGECLLGGITGDFGVNQKYRILGPALQLQRAGIAACNENKFDFLYGYPNDRSEPVQRRTGFKIVGNTHRMVKILRFNFYIRRYLKQPLLANLVSIPVNFIMKLLSKEFLRKKHAEFVAEELSSFDDRFNELWREVMNDYTVIGERTKEFLDWRFSDCPYRKYHIFVFKNKQTDALLGYFVYYRKDNTAHVADFLTKKEDGIMDSLLSEFLLSMRKKGEDSISIIYLGDEGFIDKMKEYKFSTRTSNRKIIAYANDVSSVQDCLFAEKNWHLTECDND